ncbi:hypothetical protein Q5752_006006 [Cryptotrichosporon argae]
MQSQVPRPASRLSPPPGADLQDLLAASAEAGPSRKDEEKAPKRGYRACVHCRLRKAKCDLGDVNAPSEPPCTRCRREQRNCVFLPSKRRRRTLQDEGVPELYGATTSSSHDIDSSLSLSTPPLPMPPNDTFRTPSLAFGDMDKGVGSNGSHLAHNNWMQPPSSVGQSRQPSAFSATMSAAPTAPLRPLWADNLGPMLPDTKPSPVFDPPTSISHPESTTTATTTSPTPGSLNKRRRLTAEPDSTRKIVTASFNNETDALEILASAATDENGNPVGGERRDWEVKPAKPDARLEDFVLIRRGVMNVDTLEEVVRVFFERHHPVQPIFQTMRIPHARAQLATIASVDPFLVSCIVTVVSRHHTGPGMKGIHDRAYALVRETIADYTCAGLQPTIGFVEGVLLLAENLPRERASGLVGSEMIGGVREGDGLHGIENRRSWALTGVAIRAAYGIGLDQTAIEDGERTGEHERARSVWTWCYLYDRSIGHRTGLAFWSRGPNICFNGYSNISQTGEAAALVNFPYMLAGTSGASPTPRLDVADSASLMQAQLELTQIMTNAHDILFSTRARTAALVKQGEYFKFLDHFRLALDGFRAAWRDKLWNRDDTRELTWCTFHTVRLYVAAFAFQAHVQRAQSRAEREREEGRNGVVSLFPRGSATSPDALYIYDSIEAAHEILNICVRLGQADVLRYLPSRYLINFAYSGTFALKAAYSGAMSRRDAVKTRELVDKVCAALVLACSDKDHAAGRYGQMLRILHRRLEELNDASAVPSRFPSPEPLCMADDAFLSSLLPPMPADTHVPPHMHSSAHPAPADHGGAGAGGPADPALFDLAPTDHTHGLFNFDLDPGLDLGFRLDGFWEDFTLTDSGGFPFR